MKVHMHLPKTAGTSLNEYLEKHHRVFDYGKVHNLTIMDIRKIKQCSIIVGHISMKEVDKLGVPKSDIFTILRNPIDRCISWYFFCEQGLKLFGKRLTIRDFFSKNRKHITQNCYNRQTYQLADYAHIDLRDPDEQKVLDNAKKNVDEFFYVFLFENIANETQKVFNFSLPKKNKTKKYPNKDSIHPEVIELIKNWNKLDIELYNYIVKKKGEGYEKYLIT